MEYSLLMLLMRRRLFLTTFEVFEKRVKHGLEFVIYLLNRN